MTNFIIFLILALAIGVIFQILRVSQLSSALRGKNTWEPTAADIKAQAIMMPIFLIAYFASIIWQIARWGHLALPESASVHGVETDMLLNVTWWIIIPMFIITHILLYYFGYKYRYDPNRRADYYPHNNKLEMLWTIVPTVVLSALILYGLSVWNNINEHVAEEDNPVYIELYSKQFDWTARYAGEDNKFGIANFRLIAGANTLGLDSNDAASADDKVMKGEFHLPVNRPVQFSFRSQDVIHSAYMPHFRAQMNCVPGMKTAFNFVPRFTTAEMRKKVKDEDFNYVLICNKICGAAHYNMQMTIIVESEEDYKKWLDEQATFIPEDKPEEAAEPAAEGGEEVAEQEEGGEAEAEGEPEGEAEGNTGK